MLFQELGHLQGVGAVALHAHVQCAQAAGQEPGLKGSHDGTVEGEAAAHLGDGLGIGQHGAADDVAVAVEILGGAVHHDVGAQLERLRHGGGGKGVVHHELAAVGVGDFRDLGQILHRHQGLEMVSV